MHNATQISIAVAAAIVFGAAAFAQTHGTGHGTDHGPGAAHHGPAMGQGPGQGAMMGRGPAAGGRGSMSGATAMLTTQDAGSSADMGLVHDLLANNDKIRRTVTRLPDGIKTVTESDDPQIAQAIKAHVASMSQRLKDGREFNIFSTTLPVIFENRDKIKSVVEMTDKGAVVTRTSTDTKVAAALQGHAGEVTELVQEGMVAMRRGMMSRMAMGPQGTRAGMGPGAGRGNAAVAAPEPAHQH